MQLVEATNRGRIRELLLSEVREAVTTVATVVQNIWNRNQYTSESTPTEPRPRTTRAGQIFLTKTKELRINSVAGGDGYLYHGIRTRETTGCF